MCPGLSSSEGTTWHSVQLTGFDERPPDRCVRCAPTVARLVALAPSRSTGGAEFPALPWQLSQSSAACKIPSRCVEAFAIV
jgi:hypothetical protein